VVAPPPRTTVAAKKAPRTRLIVDPVGGGVTVIAPDGTATQVPPSETFRADGHGAFGRVALPPGTTEVEVDLSGYGSVSARQDAGSENSSRASAMRWGLAAVPPVAAGAAQHFGAAGGGGATFAVVGGDPAPVLFVAETPGTAEFRADDGDDWALWNGAPAFDVRAVAAEVAGFRAAVRERFGALGDRRTLGLFVDVDAQRPKGAFSVGRHGDVVYVRVGPTDVWSGPLRLATLAAVSRGYIGETVRLPAGEDDGWFAGGGAHAFTRSLLASWQGIDAEELARDQNALLVSAAPGGTPSRATPVPSVYGALYMNTVDRDAVRTGTPFGIVSAFRELQEAAAGHGGVVTKAAVLAAFSKITGKDEAARFASAVAGKAPLVATADTCFQVAKQRVTTWEFPFDRSRSQQSGVLTPRNPEPAPVPALPFGATYRERAEVDGGLVVELAGKSQTIRGTAVPVHIFAWTARRPGPCLPTK
jgi:hypothetical protein